MAKLLRPLTIPVTLLALAVAGSGTAWAAGYDSLVEQGLFYLSRGATYGPDAVRALERAREADPARAAEDARLLAALARGYVLTSRFTEAHWLVLELEASDNIGPEVDVLREQILFDSGLGRARLVSAVPVVGLTGRLEPAEGTRLDVASRKTLARLNELFARGLEPGPNGVTLLAPEGRFTLSLSSRALAAPQEPFSLEVWAGDEMVVRLVPIYPGPPAWGLAAHSRSITLSWPPIEGATYVLYREPRHRDLELPVGIRVNYRLETLNSLGELVAASWTAAETLPPVSEVGVEADLGDDLHVRVAWVLGPGVADRVRVIREAADGDTLLQELTSPERLDRGQLGDGPFFPGDRDRALRYRVEAWIDEEEKPAAVAIADVAVPSRVLRVTEVSESIDRGSVIVVWDTLPREGGAEGYAIYRVRGSGDAGELVGRAESPFAREFEYPVDDPLKASLWRHFVIPYIRDRYFLDPEEVVFSGTVPEDTLRKRAKKGAALPDVGLSWDPYPGARLYAVEYGEKEVLVKKPYVEIKGLQTPLMATDHRVSVFAVDDEQGRVPLLTLELHYQHYRRSNSQAKKP
jgi:hypothetical protein